MGNYLVIFFEKELLPFLINLMWLLLVIFLSLIFFVIYRRMRDKELLETVTKSNRGEKSERKLVVKLLKSGIPAKSIFHDLYIKRASGDFSQIDLLVLSEVGIIVFEVKDYSGWIYGNGQYSQWTKVMAHGKHKYRFYNPIMQNNKHIKDLKKQLKQFENIPFYSVVVFFGDCEFKDISFIPEGTFIVKSKRVSKVLKIITKNNEPALYTDKNEIVRILYKAVFNGENVETQKQHVENITDMLGKHRIFD